MRVACLGWGSLVWNPGDLPIVSPWHEDGPSLPIEFARQSLNGRITLVIGDDVADVPVLWTELNARTVDAAKRALADREGCPGSAIGSWVRAGAPGDRIAEVVGPWAASHDLDGVVWTALGPKFRGERRKPIFAEVAEYLRALEGEARRISEEYVRRAPAQIITEYRAGLERKLGWTPLPIDRG